MKSCSKVIKRGGGKRVREREEIGLLLLLLLLRLPSEPRLHCSSLPALRTVSYTDRSSLQTRSPPLTPTAFEDE